MELHRPYARMGRTCLTRPIAEKQIRWPDELKQLVADRFEGRVISRKDLPDVADFFAAAYPEGEGSYLEWLYHPDAYLGKTAFAEDWPGAAANRPVLVVALEDLQAKRLAGVAIFEKDDANLSIEFYIGALHPDYRKKKAGLSLLDTLLECLRVLEDTSGAEYMTAFCCTWHNISQYLCLKQWGFRIAGIFPGQYTRSCGDGREYRACEIHFYKYIGKGESFATKPEEWQMIPEVREVWAALEQANRSSDDSGIRRMREMVSDMGT